MSKKKIALYVLGGWMALSALSKCAGYGGDSPSGHMRSDASETEEAIAALQGELRAMGDVVTPQKADSLMRVMRRIRFDYDVSDFDGDDADRVKQVLGSKEETERMLSDKLSRCRAEVATVDSRLVDGSTCFPVFLEKGECLYYDVEAESPATVAIYNMDRERVVSVRSKQTVVSDSMPVRFSAIYMVEVNPKGRQYCNISISYRPNSVERLTHPKAVKETSENCRKGDFLAREVHGIKMEKAFEEPRKLTLRGHLKAAFSGSAVALVPIQVPKGATDLLYSLRISTNEAVGDTARSFYDGMETSYKKIKVLGLPIYESKGGSGLLATLLGLNLPVREEDAYINMYVIYDAAQARKFQNGTSATQLKYNLDYSTLGTQSCNGRIPTKGHSTVYLAFENERMRYNNYVWLSAILSVPHTEYVRSKYSVE